MALHAEAGNLSRALEIEGLSCKFNGCNPSGVLRPLHAAEILPHYNVPMPPIPAAEGAHDEDGADVAVFDAALSKDVFDAMTHGFRLESDYWGREGKSYEADFYSHWYSLKEKPTNAVHQALQQLAMRIPESERHLIEGVEWWAHKRPYGDPSFSPESVEGKRFRRSYYQHHALHFDLDDVALDETTEWIHPFYGSVLYLTVEGGGPTVIIEQKSNTLAWREGTHKSPEHVNGTLVTPQQGAYVRWRGDRLHGVLPPSPPSRTDPAAAAAAAAAVAEQHRGADRGAVRDVQPQQDGEGTRLAQQVRRTRGRAAGKRHGEVWRDGAPATPTFTTTAAAAASTSTSAGGWGWGRVYGADHADGCVLGEAALHHPRRAGVR